MPRSSSRQRACETCKLRKVKCDAGQPECFRCLRSGIQCSRAAVILSGVRPDTSHNQVAKTIDLPSSQVVSPRSRTLHTSEHSSTDSSSSKSGQWDPTSPPSRYQREYLRSSPWSFISSLAELNYVSHFIYLFGRPQAGIRPETVWMGLLVHNLDESTALGHAIRATSKTVHGTATRNPKLRNASIKEYAIGVRQQNVDLECYDLTLPHPNADRVPSVQNITAAMTFSFFEILHFRGAGVAWLQHSLGAARLLEMKGPESCCAGYAHSLLLALRTVMVRETLLAKRAFALASAEWRTVPFQNKSKTAMDTLTDIVLSIPERFGHVYEPNYRHYVRFSLELLQKQQERLKSDLDYWWSLFSRDEASPNTATQPGDTKAAMKSLIGAGRLRLRADAFVYGMTIVLYYATRVAVLCWSTPPNTTRASPNPHSAEIEAHCDRILTVFTLMREGFLGTTNPGSRMCMNVPLRVVISNSPSKEQADAAQVALWTLGWV